MQIGDRVAFECNGTTCLIREPADGTILVGFEDAEHNRLAAEWIRKRYGFLLAFLRPGDADLDELIEEGIDAEAARSRA